MSHGLVNNVYRSHSTPDTNVCNQFIPQVVNHPIIRKKCVLQIMDGIKGVYQGGPGGVAAGMDLGEQRPVLRHRPRGDGPRRLAVRRRQAQGERAAAGRPPPASWASTRSRPRVSTSASPSTSPWPPTSAWASLISTRPRENATRSNTRSLIWRE